MSSAPFSGTILDVLRRRATTTPNDVYLEVSKDRALTYGEANVLAQSVIAESLKSRLPTSSQSGAPRRVALLAPNGPLLPLTHWALWTLGAIASPLSTTSEPQVWAAILEKLQATAVVVSNSLLPRLLPVLGDLVQHVSIIVLESLLPGLAPSASMSDIIDVCHKVLSAGSITTSNTVAQVSPTDTAFILFTSSAVDKSTVKAVELTHEMVLHDAHRMVKHQGLNYGDVPRRHLSWLPMGHAFELLCGL